MTETFGERFTRIRKEKGFTQESIGEKLHVSSQAVSKWELNQSEPDISTLIAIADIFDISLDELLGKEDNKVVLAKGDSKKDINNLLIRIVIISSDGDHVKINLPLALIKVAMDSDTNLFEGNKSLQSLDLKQIVSFAEKGLLGNIIEIKSADNDIVKVFIE